MKERNSDSKKSRRNVTLAWSRGAIIYCFLCGDELSIRTDKNQKFYVICNAWWTASIYSRCAGHTKSSTPDQSATRARFCSARARRGSAQKCRRFLLRSCRSKEIEKLDSKLELFASKTHRKNQARMRKALNSRIESQLRELERIAHS